MEVLDKGYVCGHCRVWGGAKICDVGTVCGEARVYDDATVCDEGLVEDDMEVCGTAVIVGMLFSNPYVEEGTHGDRFCSSGECLTRNVVVLDGRAYRVAKQTDEPCGGHRLIYADEYTRLFMPSPFSRRSEDLPNEMYEECELIRRLPDDGE